MLRHYEKRLRAAPGSAAAASSGANKGVLLSMLFVHLDKNMDGRLDHAELNKVYTELHADWPENCMPALLIVHDDGDGDDLLDNDEFVKSFNKTKRECLIGAERPLDVSEIFIYCNVSYAIGCP